MPFKKGESGNLKGRPPGSFSLVTLLKEKLQYDANASEVIAAYLKKTLEGRPEMLRDIFDRIDGKPKQDLGIGGLDGKPEIEIRIKMV